MVEVLAIIPARGGSKGLPGKNLRQVGGRSLVAWAAEAAIGAHHVDRTVGSTDDPEIRAAMEAAGVEVPGLRPAELAGDDVRDVPVILHVLDVLRSAGYEPDIVVNVRPTAPLRTSRDIDGAVSALLASDGARSVKAVSLATDHPYKMWTLRADGVLDPILPTWRSEHGGDPDVPRQSLPAVYRSSGAVDVTWVRSLRDTGMFHPGPVVAYVLDPERDIDIDTLEDLRRAERLLTGDHHG